MKKNNKKIRQVPFHEHHDSPEEKIGKSQEYKADTRSSREGRKARAEEYQPKRVHKPE